jgi:hypothetical protein
MAKDTAHTGETETTTEHDTIREWVEERGSTAAQVTEPAGDDPGSLAIIPEGQMDDSVREVSWEEFFEIFEDEELAFVHQTEKDDPEEQWFCQFTERGESTESDAPSTSESEGRDTLAGLEGNESGGTESAAGDSTGEPADEVGDLDEPAELDEAPPEQDETDGPTSPMEEVHDDRTNELDEERVGQEDEAMGTAEIDEDEIVAGEMTSRGEGSEDGVDEATFGEDEGEMRTEADVATEEPTGETPLDGEPSAPDETAESEPAEPLESEVEPTDTTGREPLESDVGDDPMETPTDEQGVDAGPIDADPVGDEAGEPIGSGAEPAEPGEPMPDEETPTEREPPESEPAEPMETEMGGDPIESDAMGDEEIGGEPIGSEGEPVEGEPGFGESSAGAAGAGAGSVDLTAEDEGKDVVDEEGERLGTVETVEDEAIQIDPDSGMTDDQRNEFGWGDHRSETHRVENDRIREVTVTEVVIFRL